MKKWTAIILLMFCFLGLAGCQQNEAADLAKLREVSGPVSEKSSEGSNATTEIDMKTTITGNLKTYYALSDGAWQCNDISYKYRLEITGIMPNAADASTFVYLSNLESISFQQAYLAAGISSNSEDYFSPEDAILVEWITE